MPGGKHKLAVYRWGDPSAERHVLYVHGGTFGADLSIGFGFVDGPAWAEVLAAGGIAVWAFDFIGYGKSSRYGANGGDAAAAAPGAAEQAWLQVQHVVRFVWDMAAPKSLSLLAHSWGATPACRAVQEGDFDAEQLILFAPILPRKAAAPPLPGTPTVPLTPAWQRARFVENMQPLEEAQIVSPANWERWTRLYVESEPREDLVAVGAVETPTGPLRDIGRMFQGEWLFDPKKIPTRCHLLVGERDTLVPVEAADVWLAAFPGASQQRLHRFPSLNHVAHLQHHRRLLHERTAAILAEAA
jgi:pimeloyl-ACP methyl ester carboxylesterase